MTKRKLNFAEADHQMAKRIAWLLLGKAASTDADSLEYEHSILVDAIPSDPDADPKRTLLVRFGLDRWQDAQTADPRMARDVVARRGAAKCGSLAAELEALRLRNEAIEPLRRALSALREAEVPLAKADKADEAGRKLVEERVRGQRVSTPHPLVLNALELVSEAVRLSGNASRGGLHGRTKSERSEAVNEWLLRLNEVGVTYKELAFILGSHPDLCRSSRSGWEAARRHVDEAREANAGARWALEISGAENLHYAGPVMDPSSAHDATPAQPPPRRNASRPRRRG